MPGSGRRSSPLSPDRPRRGRLIVFSGPSGAGKTSVVEGLSKRHSFHFSVSMTTRPARPDEVDGVDYRFVDRAAFEAAVANGEMVEWAEYSGHLYGTPKAAIEDPLAAGADVLLDIEILGARQVKEAFPEALMIYVLPPSLGALEERLRARGDTPPDAMEKRLAVAGWQIEQAKQFFDHFVVNDDLAAAIDQVAGILSSPRPS
ncbi:MAG: guanylate kinase [Actinobacteria bacterium]|nr:guanylate kinase [Actinomycetota bacterium]